MGRGWLSWGCLMMFAVVGGCSDDLGPCNEVAANELVYTRDGRVATKGQALMHESCGGTAFCHASGARGENRYGAPRGLDFDMLPVPKRLDKVLSHADRIWREVENRTMPPRGTREVLGTTVWSFDEQSRPNEPTLPPINSSEGRVILRNWLACNAPVLTDTQVPDPIAPIAADWNTIHETVIVPGCTSGACHDAVNPAGNLDFTDRCASFAALQAPDACGNPRIDGFKAKVSPAETERCGDVMPPGSGLAGAGLSSIVRWLDEGAAAPENCEP